jgi:hypothetical protein
MDWIDWLRTGTNVGHGNELPDSLNRWEVLEQLHNWRLV